MCYALAADSRRNELKIQPLPFAVKDKVWQIDTSNNSIFITK
jgi:hypothetical protein